MAYELWVSPTTGYRRRGTRMADLSHLYQEALTTRALYEPLRCCRLDDRRDDVREEMARLEFDVIGAVEGEKMTPIGYVARADLKSKTCREALRPFTHSELISDSTPLIDLLQVLASSERGFVLVGNRVHGIVTRADLQKPPVRILLFGLLSLLEMHLTFWVSKVYPGEDWKRALEPKRIEAANGILELRKQRNEEISEFDCLQFCDKRDLAASSESIRNSMNLGSAKAAGKLLRRAERLRDRLAHSQANLAGPDPWPELAQLIQVVESSLATSDAAIEELVRSGKPLEPGLGIAV